MLAPDKVVGMLARAAGGGASSLRAAHGHRSHMALAAPAAPAMHKGQDVSNRSLLRWEGIMATRVRTSSGVRLAAWSRGSCLAVRRPARHVRLTPAGARPDPGVGWRAGAQARFGQGPFAQGGLEARETDYRRMEGY